MNPKSVFSPRLLFAVFAFILSAKAQAVDQRAYVSAIHNQYLSTDFKSESDVQRLFLALRDGLEKAQSANPEDFVAEENLLGVYNQVLAQAQEERLPKDLIKEATGQRNFDSIFDKLKDYQAKHGQIIPVGWTLPGEFKIIVAEVIRKYEVYKGRTEYALGLFSWLHDGEEMPEQIQVIRYPNTVILDKIKGVGDLSDGHKWQKPGPMFSFDSELDAIPPKDGLYLLNLKMKGKEPVQGWFVVSEMTLNEAPMVSSPFMGQIFKSSNPTVKWLDFTSPQFRDFETRKRMLSVSKTKDNSRSRIWQRLEISPDDRESIVVDSSTDNGSNGNVKLTPGNYEFETTFQERWFFGGLLMQRASTSVVPFSVTQ